MKPTLLWKLTVALVLGVLVSVVAVTAIAAVRRPYVAPRALSASEVWSEAITAVDGALAANDLTGASLAWQRAFVAALQDRAHWEGLIEVADARLRIGRQERLEGMATQRARELYLSALFRARQHDSAEGVLRAGTAFEALGDQEVAAQARRIAAKLTPLAARPAASR
jgi:hypothetical protein